MDKLFYRWITALLLATVVVGMGIIPANTPFARAAGASYKLLVKQNGMYQVTYADLLAVGAPVDTLDPNTLQLFSQGQEVAIYVHGEGDGSFDSGDYLLFYGQKISTRYTDTNVYWLAYDIIAGKRMAIVDGMPHGTAVSPVSYLTTYRIETDRIYKRELPNGTNNDHWFWDGIRSYGTPISKSFSFNLSNLASTTENIQVRGLLKGDPSFATHHSNISVNGHLIDNGTFYSNNDYAFEVTIPQSHLVEGANTFTVTAMADVGLAGDLIFVNWFEVDYYDRFVAESSRLAFEGDQAGTWNYQVSGFSSDMIEVFDITAPLSPTRIINPSVRLDGSTYLASFDHAITTPANYLALTPEQRMGALSIFLDQPSDLRNTTNGADWIGISYGDFADELQPLADFRATQGLRTVVIDVQDIYDEFSGGVFDPYAIHDFLAYAYNNWNLPRPQFVLLNGDGNYDYKNLTGTATPNYIPPYLADVDPFLSETVADNRYVTLVGNDIFPDMALGRLPSNSGAETTTMVNKIIAYEQNPPIDGWNANVSFVADNEDTGGNFDNLSDEIVNGYLPTNYTEDKIYLGINYSTQTEARLAIINAINQGRLIVSYIGHASTNWWAEEKLLQVSDISFLTNSDRLPFMVPMTCLEGYYINPSVTSASFGEAVVRAAEKGAIASWSPTGLGIATGHDYLEKALFDALFTQHIDQIGLATLYALENLYTSTTQYWDLIDTYVLFGDPATHLQILPYPTAVDMTQPIATFLPSLGVLVEWQTISELDRLGFNLYRAVDVDGLRYLVNPELIASQSPGSLTGAAYSYLDSGMTGWSTYYWVESLGTSGASIWYGPVQTHTRLYLPVLFNTEIDR